MPPHHIIGAMRNFINNTLQFDCAAYSIELFRRGYASVVVDGYVRHCEERITINRRRYRYLLGYLYVFMILIYLYIIHILYTLNISSAEYLSVQNAISKFDFDWLYRVWKFVWHKRIELRKLFLRVSCRSENKQHNIGNRTITDLWNNWWNKCVL